MTIKPKFKTVNTVLWSAYILALFASVNHLAWAFGRLEFYPLIGWIPALAVDFGLAALAYAIQQRKRARRQTKMLWLGVIAFSAISAFANLLHAVAVVSADAGNANITWETIKAIDALTLTKAIILSASLPLLVVYLGEIVSSDDAEAAKVAEKEARKAEKAEEAPALPEAKAPVVATERATGNARFDAALATIAEKASGEFGQADVQSWVDVKKTGAYALLSYGLETGMIEQVDRGRYRTNGRP